MEKKRVVPVWVSVILLALCVACVVGIVFLFTVDQAVLTVIISVLFLCAIVMAILYCMMGYKKNAARFFAIFSIILSLAVLLQVARYYVNANQPRNQQEIQIEMENTEEMPQGEALDDAAPAILIKDVAKITIPVLIFGILFTLSAAKDLGKKKSYWLIGSSVVLSLVNYVIGSIRIQNNALNLELFNVSGVEFSIFVLCVIYGIMIYAKYKDKAARGTK